MTKFPVKAERHHGDDDIPPTPDVFAIFDARGLWANIGGITFQAPVTAPGAATMVDHVARMVNAAYEQGRADAQADMREALGLEV